MSDSKVYMLPDSGNNHLDPNMLLSMLGNGNGFGGGNWIWVIFLFFLYGCGGNGMFGRNGNLTDTIASTAERDLLMSAIQGNGNAIDQLAIMLNCDVNNIKDAIQQVSSSICSVGNQVGMTGQQVINSVQQGNINIAQQLCQCCCSIKDAIAQGNYQNQINTINAVNGLSTQLNTVNTGLERGFSSNAYETQAQTCSINQNIGNQTQSLKDTATANTNAILSKIDQLQTNAFQDKISELQETKTRLQNQISQEQQNQVFAQMIAPLQSELAAIKQAQPSTTTVQYPNLIGVPAGQYYRMYQNSFWT